MCDERQFPRFAVFWRTWIMTGRVLGSLPMVIVTPTLAALVATVLAAATPPTTTIQRHAVLIPPSLGDSVASAVVGAAVGILAVVAIVWCGVWLWYRITGADREWEAVYAATDGDGEMQFELRSKGRGSVLPFAPITRLGHDPECWIRTPSGKTKRFSTRAGMNVLIPNGGLYVRLHEEPAPGVYEFRWYAPHWPSVYEVARGNARVDWPSA